MDARPTNTMLRRSSAITQQTHTNTHTQPRTQTLTHADILRIDAVNSAAAAAAPS